MPYEYGVDMWSIGCTLYEMYTGKILFTGDSNNQMLKAIMEIRGRFTPKLYKRGQLAINHFDELGQFVSVEQDRVLGKVRFCLIPLFPTPWKHSDRLFAFFKHKRPAVSVKLLFWRRHASRVARWSQWISRRTSEPLFMQATNTSGTDKTIDVLGIEKSKKARLVQFIGHRALDRRKPQSKKPLHNRRPCGRSDEAGCLSVRAMFEAPLLRSMHVYGRPAQRHLILAYSERAARQSMPSQRLLFIGLVVVAYMLSGPSISRNWRE